MVKTQYGRENFVCNKPYCTNTGVKNPEEFVSVPPNEIQNLNSAIRSKHKELTDSEGNTELYQGTQCRNCLLYKKDHAIISRDEARERWEEHGDICVGCNTTGVTGEWTNSSSTTISTSTTLSSELTSDIVQTKTSCWSEMEKTKWLVELKKHGKNFPLYEIPGRTSRGCRTQFGKHVKELKQNDIANNTSLAVQFDSDVASLVEIQARNKQNRIEEIEARRSSSARAPLLEKADELFEKVLSERNKRQSMSFGAKTEELIDNKHWFEGDLSETPIWKYTPHDDEIDFDPCKALMIKGDPPPRCRDCVDRINVRGKAWEAHRTELSSQNPISGEKFCHGACRIHKPFSSFDRYYYNQQRRERTIITGTNYRTCRDCSIKTCRRRREAYKSTKVTMANEKISAIEDIRQESSESQPMVGCSPHCQTQIEVWYKWITDTATSRGLLMGETLDERKLRFMSVLFDWCHRNRNSKRKDVSQIFNLFERLEEINGNQHDADNDVPTGCFAACTICHHIETWFNNDYAPLEETNTDRKFVYTAGRKLVHKLKRVMWERQLNKCGNKECPMNKSLQDWYKYIVSREDEYEFTGISSQDMFLMLCTQFEHVKAHLKSFGLDLVGIKGKSFDEITNEINDKCVVNCFFCSRKKTIEYGDCIGLTHMTDKEIVYYQNRNDDDLLWWMSSEHQSQQYEDEETEFY